ncbi:GGDEF domain-containing protein [Paenibacillus sp. NPDC056722]|uniref:GGDEF domain-containing protein n=1 Tax=Paenibacillus sp. NPDC056722 TaxID=3345924 RepID=UPI0036837306
MIAATDLLNAEVWHRKIMNGYWIVLAFMLIAQVLFVLCADQLRLKSSPGTESGYLFIASNILIVICVASAEIWLRSTLQYNKQAIVGCGFIISYLFYFVIEPFVDGAQMALMMPIMISLIYFDRKLLYTLGLFSIFFYAAVYFGLERVYLKKPLLEFIAMEFVFLLFLLMARAVIVRSKETGEYLEQLTKSEQGLLVERAISDKLLKIDALTGLYNHKTFHEYLDSLLEQCENNGLMLQLALFDIDNFKRVNDTYGHWVGDLVLKEVAAKVGEKIGLNDFAARYGGEEFAVIYTDRNCSEAYSAAEELRLTIEQMEHPYAGGHPITVSIGLCRYQLGDGKEQLFRKTDDALYQAKRSGKNRVVTSSVDSQEANILSYG